MVEALRIRWIFSSDSEPCDFLSPALADQKVQPPFYQYSDLKSATRDFHQDNRLGKGGFGEVFKVRSSQFSLLIRRNSAFAKKSISFIVLYGILTCLFFFEHVLATHLIYTTLIVAILNCLHVFIS